MADRLYAESGLESEVNHGGRGPPLMEQMPYQPSGNSGGKIFPAPSVYDRPTFETGATTDWRQRLPVLHGDRVTLRELQRSDAGSLLALLTTSEVARFISPPPTTLEGFERFIDWTLQRRQAGEYICFAVVPDGGHVAVGIIQVRALAPGFETAEWGFAVGSPFWGRGLFQDGAAQVVRFVFETVGAKRLEARSSVENLRGNGALRKMGAVREGTLRQSFLKDGRYHDQHLWSILDTDWRAEGARRVEFLLSGSTAAVASEVATRVH